jgi:CRISPR-associated protein Cas2
MQNGEKMERENYYFDSSEEIHDDRVFVLIIYDITDNKLRLKLAKMLLGYGFRIQKSAFEATITKKKYNELLERLPAYVTMDDSIRVYKIIGRGQVTSFGKTGAGEQEEIIVI